MTDKTQGLIDKYTVHRNNDTEGKHDDCRYFVLDPQHDPIALEALWHYARSARRRGFAALADDLNAWVRQVEDTQRPAPDFDSIEELRKFLPEWGYPSHVVAAICLELKERSESKG